MKLPDPEHFDFKECIVCDEACWLVTPKRFGVTWTEENSRFRSALVRQHDHSVISQGFRKFTNFGESPSFEPWEFSWPVEARLKLDGSLLIVSKFKGQLIIRTRGSYDYAGMTNANEIPDLIKEFSGAFDNGWLNRETYSFLYEWTSPNNVIVLREYNKPRITLIGIIAHDNARYEDQFTLDLVAEKLNLHRPEKYSFNDLTECHSTVLPWKGKEGVVTFSPCGQILKKWKATEYLDLHRLAAGLSTIGGVLDTFLNCPEYFSTIESFTAYIETVADFEIASRNKSLIQDVIIAYNKLLSDDQRAKDVVKSVKEFDWSLSVTAQYITTHVDGYSRAFAFNHFHGRPHDAQLIKRAMKSNLGLK